ncbi:MAG: hypothetical protein AAGD01_15270 [Acidobacteriota bacterium]
MVAGLLAGGEAEAQQQQSPFADSTNQLAVDVPVRLVRESSSWRQGTFQGWEIGDFEVLAEGRSLPVVALDAPQRREVLIWLDRTLSDDRTLRRGLEALAQHAEALVEQGSVEVVSGEEQPRRLLGPTQDEELLANTLLAAAREPGGMDAQRQLREAFREEGGASVLGLEEAKRWAVLETLHGAAALEQLAGWLARAPRPPETQRVLILVSQGLDLSPETFYGVPPEAAPGVVSLAQRSRRLGQVAAGYGWQTVVVRPALADPDGRLKPGRRIGKVRIFYGLTYEEERQPEKAEALVELARSKQAAGDLEGARDDLGRALHHFYGDPRTAPLQAEALLQLAEVLEALGEEEGARRAREEAAGLEGGLLKRDERGRSAWGDLPGDPRLALEALVESTGGQWVEGDGSVWHSPTSEARRANRLVSDLGRALAGLGTLRRLTVQLADPVPGTWRSLEVRIDRVGHHVHGPSWLRVGTPPEVAEARLLSTLAAVSRGEEGSATAAGLDLRWLPTAGVWEVLWSGRGRRQGDESQADREPGDAQPPRLVALSGGESQAPVWLQAGAALREEGTWRWRLSSPPGMPSLGPWLAVTLHDPQESAAEALTAAPLRVELRREDR